MTAKKRKNAAFIAILLVIIFSLFTINVVSAADRTESTYDEALANFRNVQAGRIGRNNLYRSQHPANDTFRSLYANLLAESKGVRTVLNLSDSKKKLDKFMKDNIVGSSYYYKKLYNGGRVYTAGISSCHNDALYRSRIATSLKFFAKNKGPYLVHCKVGRDRTGMVILVLESLMGAPYSFIVDDYARSFENVNGYNSADAQKAAIVSTNAALYFITGRTDITDWSKVNLAPYAEQFLKLGGMSVGEIAALKNNLSLSYPNRDIGFTPIPEGN